MTSSCLPIAQNSSLHNLNWKSVQNSEEGPVQVYLSKETEVILSGQEFFKCALACQRSHCSVLVLFVRWSMTRTESTVCWLSDHIQRHGRGKKTRKVWITYFCLLWWFAGIVMVAAEQSEVCVIRGGRTSSTNLLYWFCGAVLLLSTFVKWSTDVKKCHFKLNCDVYCETFIYWTTTSPLSSAHWCHWLPFEVAHIFTMV